MLRIRKKKVGVGGAVITPYATSLVNKVLSSSRLSYGPYLKKFENKFAELCHRRFAVSANSGTSALQVAVHALKEIYGWKNGDEVIVPAITFIATSNVVIQNRLTPIFVDVDPLTYQIDTSLIESKITKKTRAIMPVHLFGLSAEMDKVMAIAHKYRLKVIEDSCETVGVRYRGRPVGSMGDIACFSTYMAHLVTTGVGGLALTNDQKIAVVMRSLINHGRDSIYIACDDDTDLEGKPRFEMAERRFSFVAVGYSYRLTEMEGALGVAELTLLKRNIATRQKYAAYLRKNLEPYGDFFQLPFVPAHAEHAFMMFPILIKDSRISRNDLIAWLENHNVETRYLMPLINQPVYKKLFGEMESRYPVACYINKKGFYIGCHPGLTKADLDYVILVFGEFFKHALKR